jgi:sodium transport system permease protein
MLGPAILVVGIRFGIKAEREVSDPVFVFGANNAPTLVASLRSRGVKVTEAIGKRSDAEVAITSGNARVALVIPEDYAKRLRDGQLGQLDVVLDSSQPKTLGLVRRLERALGETLQTLGALRLLARGVSPSVAHPARVNSVDLATPEQAAAKLLYVVPMMLMLSAFAGGMNIAIDTTAGERERKSLEALLLTPASRLGLFAGKWLTATLAATMVTALGTSLFALVPPLLPLEELGLRMNFDWSSALVTLLWLIPLAGFGVALEMLVASFARTFKEAQTYLSLFLLVPTLSSLFLVYSPITSSWWTALVPALGQVTAILDLLKGEPPQFSHLALAWIACFGYTAFVLVALERLLRNERVVFGR